MLKSEIEALVFNIALKVAEKNFCELEDVELVKEGHNLFLRVFIDKGGNVTIEDCENVSRELDSILDDLDPIKEPYFLEVSSPGLDKQLKKPKDFIKYMGREVDVKLFRAIDKQKLFTGTLIGFENDVAKISVNDKIYEINIKDAAYIKLAVNF